VFLSLTADAEQHACDSATADGTAGVDTGATASGVDNAPGDGNSTAGNQHSLVQQSCGVHHLTATAAATTARAATRATTTTAAAATTTAATSVAGTNRTSCAHTCGATANGQRCLSASSDAEVTNATATTTTTAAATTTGGAATATCVDCNTDGACTIPG